MRCWCCPAAARRPGAGGSAWTVSIRRVRCPRTWIRRGSIGRWPRACRARDGELGEQWRIVEKFLTPQSRQPQRYVFQTADGGDPVQVGHAGGAIACRLIVSRNQQLPVVTLTAAVTVRADDRDTLSLDE